ncbi:MAG: hypothetical protein SF028_07255 [Candidatus Sumerlaeia bacterium]|nr:hypothetical protein [Candidatus Sumerlaeia bacterium]
MTRRPFQATAFFAAGCLGTLALFLPREAPAAAAWALAAAAGLSLAGLLGDALLQRWLRDHWGQPVTPGDFLRQCAPGLVARVSFSAAAVLALMGARSLLVAEFAPVLLAAAGGAAAVSLLAWLAGVALAAKREGRAADPYWAAGTHAGLGAELRAALDFQRVVGPRLAGALAKLAAVWFGGMAADAVLFILLLLLAQFIHDGALSAPVPGRGEFFFQIAYAVALGFAALLSASVLLAGMIEVAIARKTGRPPRTGTGELLGRALEAVGIGPTFLWGALLGGVGALALGATFGRLRPALLAEGLSAQSADLAALGAFLAAVCAVALAHLYAPAVFARRDCGWAAALQASVSLAGYDGWRAPLRLAVAGAWLLSIIRAPAGLHLLLSPLDGREVLLGLLLGEKTAGEPRTALRDLAQDRPDALRKPYALLEAGRHLEALNAFQLHLHRNRTDVDAMRGQCLALVALGNAPMAREKLSLWQSLAPEDPEPARLLAQVEARGRPVDRPR